MHNPRIVVLTGAGISAESGISTFRDARGLWNNHRIEDVASPQAFARTPELVHRFYDARRRHAAEALPNAAHYALADLARELGSTGGGHGVLVVTQNVDDLHERAGSGDVAHIHGELNSALCTACGQRHQWTSDLIDEPACPTCGLRALRPDIVWFGESVYHWEAIQIAVEHCETFIVIGTSAAVWPASSLVDLARSSGARTVLANLELHGDISSFDEVEIGPATKVVPELVNRILELDYDPDSDWAETSPELQRTSVYIGIESVIADGPFVLDTTRDFQVKLPGLIPGARNAVRDLAQDFNVVLVASDELADSPGFPLFWNWYNTHLGSYRGHLADQLLLTGRPGAVRGWHYYVQSDWADDGPPAWVGEIVRLGPKGIPSWSEVVAHIVTSALERAAV